MEMCGYDRTRDTVRHYGTPRILGAMAALLLSCPALAAAPPPPSSALTPLLQCRTIADGPARLACYDGQVDGLKKATDSNDVLVVNRAELQKARRSIFGLLLPTPTFLDRDSKGREVEINEINGKLASATAGSDGFWHFTLDDGARWVQIEGHDFVRDPKPGMPVRIRKAAMGSFLANFDGQTAVRVERVR